MSLPLSTFFMIPMDGHLQTHLCPQQALVKYLAAQPGRKGTFNNFLEAYRKSSKSTLTVHHCIAVALALAVGGVRCVGGWC